MTFSGDEIENYKLSKIIRLILIVLSLCAFSIAQADDVPDLSKTPGKSRPGLTKKIICATKWGKDERHVTDAMKREVFSQYDFSGYSDAHCVPNGHHRTCEIDHLISRELGSADIVDNLWPEAYGTSPWNAQLKDKLENRLHKEMCAGAITLNAARLKLVNDWRRAYREYYGTP